jgi:hypothetical protein
MTRRQENVETVRQRVAVLFVVGLVALAAVGASLAAVEGASRRSGIQITHRLAPCIASQLRARTGGSVPGAGSIWTTIVLANAGPSCYLSGYPTLIGVMASGRRVPLLVHHMSSRGFPASAAIVAGKLPTSRPREARGRLVLHTTSTCGASKTQRTFHVLLIDLPHRHGAVWVDVYIDAACGVDETKLGVLPGHHET